jgi:hypothetical protein
VRECVLENRYLNEVFVRKGPTSEPMATRYLSDDEG